EALTLAPMRCSQFLSASEGNWVTRPVSRGMQKLSQVYKRALSGCLNWRWSVLAVSLLIFLGSLTTISSLRKEFLPAQDQSRFLVNLYTKMGSSIDFTDGVFRKAEDFFKTRPEIDKYYVAVGGFGGGLVNQGISFVTLKDPADRPVVAPFKKRPTQQEFMSYVREELKKLSGVERVSILDLSLTGFSAQRGYPVEFQLQGVSWDKLVDLSIQMRKKLTDSGYMSDVDTDYRPNMPEIEILPNRDTAAELGVSMATIANAVSTMVGGIKMLPNKYTDSTGHRDDIQIKLKPEENKSALDIDKIYVRNIHGEVLPLSRVVDIKQSSTLLTITRYNRERGIGIFGNIATGKSQSDVIAYVQTLGKEMLPEGYHLTLSGSSQAFKESFQSLMFALLLGIFVAYMVLASQFNSFLHPLVILLALPFSITGALWAMRLTDTSVNIYSLIGLLLLMGIVKKNSILLVEFTNHQRAEGLSVQDALLAACPVRLRPILMTSIATITGALPAAFALGAGAETIRPMAIAVIGGVFVSTFLTLFVVPCAYSLIARFENRTHQQELTEALKAIQG
ncbi:MAG: efflux RND transporter permease subunit, partial [Myxococcaceae bacterium]